MRRQVRVPELFIVRCRFREFGGTPRHFIPDERLMTKDILETITQLTADFGDALVSRAAVLARVTAVLHQRDRRVSGPDNMISRGVDRTDATVGRRYGRWLTDLSYVLRWMVRHAGAYEKARIGSGAAIKRHQLVHHSYSPNSMPSRSGDAGSESRQRRSAP